MAVSATILTTCYLKKRIRPVRIAIGHYLSPIVFFPFPISHLPILLFCLSIAANLSAQEPPSLEELRRMQQYPDFVGNTREATPSPTPTPAAVDETDEQSGRTPTQRTQILVEDLASTNSWTQVQGLLEPELEEMRMLMLSSAPSAEIADQQERLEAILNLIVAMSPYQAPLQENGLAFYSERIKRQLDFLVVDYRDQAWRQWENTDELLSRSIREWNYLLQQSDLDRGADVEDRYGLPDDWEPGTFEIGEFREMISAWNARRLLAGYTERHSSIQHALERRDDFRFTAQAREMGELARELATRIYEVPLTSRIAFRNNALRMDVQAENLSNYLEQDNRPYALRQLRYIEDTMEQADAFLRLRERETASSPSDQ